MVIIFLFVLNYLTEGKILETINNIIGKKERFSNENKPKIGHYTEPVNEEMTKLYRFLQSLVRPKMNLDWTNNTNFPMDELKSKFIEGLTSRLSINGWSFTNIDLLGPLSYYKNSLGREIEPFKIKTTVSYNRKVLGTFIIYFEIILDINKNNISDSIIFQDIKLIKRSDDEQNPVHVRSMKQNSELAREMASNMNDLFVSRDGNDDLFIKPTEKLKNVSWENDSEHSLIPSIIEFSNTNDSYGYESDSINITTDNY